MTTRIGGYTQLHASRAVVWGYSVINGGLEIKFVKETLGNSRQRRRGDGWEYSEGLGNCGGFIWSSLGLGLNSFDIFFCNFLDD